MTIILAKLDKNNNLTRHILSSSQNCSAEKLALDHKWDPGSYRIITEAEAEELQRPSAQELYEEQKKEQRYRLQRIIKQINSNQDIKESFPKLPTRADMYNTLEQSSTIYHIRVRASGEVEYGYGVLYSFRRDVGEYFIRFSPTGPSLSNTNIHGYPVNGTVVRGVVVQPLSTDTCTVYTVDTFGAHVDGSFCLVVNI